MVRKIAASLKTTKMFGGGYPPVRTGIKLVFNFSGENNAHLFHDKMPLSCVAIMLGCTAMNTSCMAHCVILATSEAENVGVAHGPHNPWANKSGGRIRLFIVIPYSNSGVGIEEEGTEGAKAVDETPTLIRYGYRDNAYQVFHFPRQVRDCSRLRVVWCSSAEQEAGILTESLLIARDAFQRQAMSL